MNKNLPEILFPIYFWGFIYLKPFIVDNPLSTLILTIFVSLISAIFVLDRILHKKEIITKWFVFITVVLLLFYIDTNLRQDNPIGQRYFYEFIFSAYIPSIIFSQIKTPRLFLKYFSLLGVLAILLFGLDGVNDYPLYGDYMTFGFNLVMPSFFASALALIYFKKNIAILPLLFCFYNLILYSNRGALLSSFIYLFVLVILTKENRKKVIGATSIYLFIIILLIVNMESLLGKLLIYAETYGINSYGLNQFATYFNGGDNNQLFSGRLQIWDNAINLIKSNFILGTGIGSFETIYGVYSHNLILDFFIFHGFIGFVIYCYLLYKSIITLQQKNSQIRIFILTILLLMVPKLLLSSYFVSDMAFWCFISFGFKQIKHAN